MSINEMIAKINEFTKERDWEKFHIPKNLAASISIESAELMECFQWDSPTAAEIIEDEGRIDSVRAELADVMIYSFRLCSTLSLDPLEIMSEKLEENRARYPVEASRGSSKKYDSLRRT